MRRPHLLALAAAATLLPAHTRAASRYWVNAILSGNANWSNTKNWSATANGTSGAPVPTSADDVFLTYNDPLGQSVTPPVLDVSAAVASLSIGSVATGTPNLIQSANVTFSSAGDELIGFQANGRGAYTQSAGVNNALANLTLAPVNARGTYNLSNTAALNVASTLLVGDAGAGIFNQSGSLSSVHAPTLQLGNTGTSAGQYNLNDGSLTIATSELIGYTTSLSALLSATFIQSAGSNSTPSLLVGFNGGTSGTYTLAGGSLSTTATTIARANSPATGSANGTFAQSGGSFTTDSLTVADLDTPNGVVTGTFSLGPAGTLTVNQGIIVGSNLFNTFTTTHAPTGHIIQSGGSITTPSLSIAYGNFLGTNRANGSYTLSGGSLNVTSTETLGSPINAATFTQTGGSNATPTLVLTSLSTYNHSAGTFNVSSLDLSGTYSLSGTASLAATSISFNTPTASFVQTGTAPLSYSTFSQSQGTATFDTLPVGSPAGISSTYSLTGGLLTAKKLNLYPSALLSIQSPGSYAPTTITQTGGVATFAPAVPLTLDGPTASPASYTLTGGSLTTSDAQVGYAAAGSFLQTGGTHSNLTQLSIGDNAGSAGFYSLAGTSASFDTRHLIVGNAGRGTFAQSDGFAIASVQLDVAAVASSIGSVSLSGGTLVATSESIGPAGTASFSQIGGTHLVLKDLALAAGSYSFSNGSLSILGNLTLATPQPRPAIFTQTGGSATLTGELTIYPSATFTLTAPAHFTLATSPLTWNYTSTSPIDTLRHYLHDGLLTSTSLTTLTALAYYETGSSSVITQLTLLGDLNLDGKLNADDYALLDRSFNKHPANPHWTDGDLNYDGTVNTQDYLLIDHTYGQAHGFSPGFLAQRESQFGPNYVSTLLASLPEPASLSLLTLIPLTLLPRRRQ